ncbi:CAMK protein kinase [Polytolypa hystricis UAMH7299]|uniref:non-specific serine/threonine protein kinase n=1 Tax=Polytolypa hystricis (strain UAMH7299) TaxID=1447883 RepID=A0A2B7Z077_POLH7|nr:CAMK protein kinase [Polytolypa hystricis UAMH7299]
MPSKEAVQRKKVDIDAWKTESSIMNRTTHPHIVKLFWSNFDPHPQLYLEYIPCGSLEDQEHISPDESILILHQCLSALAYLHGIKPPIVHRAIKPGNILVHYRRSGKIYVKFGDFGMPRESWDLSTLCGSLQYIAPEIYSMYEYYGLSGRERRGYTPAVDIWSLGLVVYELICDLPQYNAKYETAGTAWCEKVVKRFKQDLERWPNKLGQFLLDNMVVISPELRASAQDCYERVLLLPSGAEDGSLTPRPVAFQNSAGKADAENPRTVLWQPNSAEAYLTNLSRSGPSVDDLTGSPQAGVTTKDYSTVSTCPGRSLRADSRHKSELKYFLEDYSEDPLNSLYVGLSLASWGREQGLGSWASQSSHDPSSFHQDQPSDTVAQADQGRPVASSPSSIPQAHGNWYAENGYSVGDDDTDEKYTTAMLLQAIHQKSK